MINNEISDSPPLKSGGGDEVHLPNLGLGFRVCLDGPWDLVSI